MKKTLDNLKINEYAVVKKINLGGQERIRLNHLGVHEDVVIKCVMDSPLNNPRAYIVKGTMFALRNKEAMEIEVI